MTRQSFTGKNGSVVAWGGPQVAGSVPVDLNNIVAVASGENHALALRADGTVVAWVADINAASGTYSATIVPAGLSNVVTSPLRFLDPPGGMKLDEQGFHLRLSGLSGKGYVVIFASTNVTGWQPIFTNIPVVGVLDYIDSDATNFATRFYRATESELSLGGLRFATPFEFLPTTNGLLNLRIEGATGLGPVILYGSTNLLNWEPLATNPPAIGTGVFHPPVNSESPAQFFKVSEER